MPAHSHWSTDGHIPGLPTRRALPAAWFSLMWFQCLPRCMTLFVAVTLRPIPAAIGDMIMMLKPSAAWNASVLRSRVCLSSPIFRAGSDGVSPLIIFAMTPNRTRKIFRSNLWFSQNSAKTVAFPFRMRISSMSFMIAMSLADDQAGVPGGTSLRAWPRIHGCPLISRMLRMAFRMPGRAQPV